MSKVVSQKNIQRLYLGMFIVVGVVLVTSVIFTMVVAPLYLVGAFITILLLMVLAWVSGAFAKAYMEEK